MVDVTDSAQLDAPGTVASSNWLAPDLIVGTLEAADGTVLRTFTRETLIEWARSLAARDERCADAPACTCSRCSPRCGGAP